MNAAATATAAAIAIHFAPPIDHPLRYETVETVPASGGRGVVRFTLEQEARFTREGDGYALTLRTTGWRSEAPSTQADALALAIRPTMGVPLTFRISADGTATGVIDGDANWAAALAGMRAAASVPGAAPGRRAIVDTLAALPRSARDAQLLEAADDIVPRVRDGGTDRHTVSNRPQPGGAVLYIVEDVEVSAASGLIVRHHLAREVRPAGGAGAIALGESETKLTGY